MTTSAVDSKQIVEQALAGMGDIATLPQVTIKIIETVEDPKSTARELHEIIKNDPVLSARVLKIVNSAFYGLPGQIASVDRAIVLLGLAAVKNIAIAASIAKLFKANQISKHFTATDLWRHSLAVAVASRAMTRMSPRAGNADEFFVAGLIHDIGMLVERQAFADEFGGLLDACLADGTDLLESERRAIGADHQEFGTALTTRWKFPRHLRAAVGFHHNPMALSDELKPLGVTIYVADTLACHAEMGMYLSARYQEIPESYLEIIGITPAQLEEIRCDLTEAVQSAEACL